MLKPYSNPYGYKKLLAYKKAEELQKNCRWLTANFPKTKTLLDLADQMDRSARSGKQNIIEGWKRNSTKEYYDFLGFSIGAIAELEEDCDDIWRGVYPELLVIKKVMGEKGLKGKKGSRGELELNNKETLDIDKLKFYPLDKSLPPVVKLKLRCKELNFLLDKLQKSLEEKMSKEGSLSRKEKIKIINNKRKKDDDNYEKLLTEAGFIKKADGQVIKR